MLLMRLEALEVRRERRDAPRLNQYGISPGISVTLVLFAFLQVSLVTVAMIAGVSS